MRPNSLIIFDKMISSDFLELILGCSSFAEMSIMHMMTFGREMTYDELKMVFQYECGQLSESGETKNEIIIDEMVKDERVMGFPEMEDFVIGKICECVVWEKRKSLWMNLFRYICEKYPIKAKHHYEAQKTYRKWSV